MKENIFTGYFTADELQAWFREFCEDGFSIDIYGQTGGQFGIARSVDVNNRLWSWYGVKGNSNCIRRSEKLRLTYRMDYSIYQGQENIYIQFLIEAEHHDHLCYVNWGYKEDDVRENKMLELVNLFHKIYSENLLKF